MRGRPCDGYELHAAEVLAADDGQAWLRLWVQALVLAFLTGRPVPRVPAPLRPAGGRSARASRECLLATVVDGGGRGSRGRLAALYGPRSLAG